MTSRLDSGEDPDSGYADLPAVTDEERHLSHNVLGLDETPSGFDARPSSEPGLGFGFGEKPDYGRDLATDTDNSMYYNQEITVEGGADMIKSLYDHEDSSMKDFGLGSNYQDIPQLPPQLELYKQQTFEENKLDFDQRRRDARLEYGSGSMVNQSRNSPLPLDEDMFNKTPERAQSSMDGLRHKMNQESGDWLGLSTGVKLEGQGRRRSTGNASPSYAVEDEETRQKWTVQRPTSQRPRDNLQLSGAMDFNPNRNARGQSQRTSLPSAGFVPRERGGKTDKYSRDNLKSASNAKFTAEATSKDYKEFNDFSSGRELRATPSWYVVPKPSKKSI